jgi:PKHD-type hydroxylase
VFKQIDNVLTPGELQQLRALLAGAAFVDGAATAGDAARGVKHNLQAVGQSPELDQARRIVNEALLRNEEFLQFALPFRVLPPLFSRYDAGMAYGEHTDSPIMGREPAVRSDVALTLFLTSPGDYDGGELVVDVDRDARRIKLAGGAAIVYLATSLHRVEPVTRGQRLAAVTWVQSVVRDPARREMLADLAATLRFMRAGAPNAIETQLVAKTRANLLRLWAEV